MGAESWKRLGPTHTPLDNVHRVIGVLVQPSPDEGAVRSYRQVLGGDVVEGRSRQGAANPLAAEGVEDLGVRHDDNVPLAAKFCESGELTVDMRNSHATTDTNARELRFSRLTGSLT